MKILDFEQGTKEWHDARRCRITGTKLKAVMGTPEARRGLIAELIGEEGTEQGKLAPTTMEMERGTAEEAFAIRTFTERTGKNVQSVGLCVHDEYDWLALSPDGVIFDERIKTQGGSVGIFEAVEVKSPDSKKAILYRIENMIEPEETGLMGKKGDLLAGAPFLGIPSEYKWQVVHYFIVNTDLQKLHFCVYDARFIDEDMKLYVVTVERSNELLQEAIAEAMEALLAFRETWMRWKEIVLPAKF